MSFMKEPDLVILGSEFGVQRFIPTMTVKTQSVHMLDYISIISQLGNEPKISPEKPSQMTRSRLGILSR
jgi:hypothetical protein